MSWILAAVGIFGLYLAGKKSRWGWAVGLGAQVLWIAYALITREWGFIASALAYGAVYANNFRAWSPRRNATPNEETADMNLCKHKLYADGNYLSCDVCQADFPHKDGCNVTPCTCDTSGILDFSGFTADSITDRVLDDIRSELDRLSYELDVANEVARSNLAAYKDIYHDTVQATDKLKAVRDLHQQEIVPLDGFDAYCSGCRHAWPCPTTTALGDI